MSLDGCRSMRSSAQFHQLRQRSAALHVPRGLLTDRAASELLHSSGCKEKPERFASQHRFDGQPGNSRLPVRRLNGDCFAVELGESKAVERLIVGGPLIPENANGNGLTKQQGFLSVRAPMHAGHVPTQGDIARQLV